MNEVVMFRTHPTHRDIGWTGMGYTSRKPDLLRHDYNGGEIVTCSEHPWLSLLLFCQVVGWSSPSPLRYVISVRTMTLTQNGVCAKSISSSLMNVAVCKTNNELSVHALSLMCWPSHVQADHRQRHRGAPASPLCNVQAIPIF